MDYPPPFSYQPAYLLIDKFVVELPVRSDVAEAIRRQLSADMEFKFSDPEDHLSALLRQGLARKFSLPSDAQIRFAQRIGHVLEVDPGLDTLQSKEKCHKFIADNVDLYRSILGNK